MWQGTKAVFQAVGTAGTACISHFGLFGVVVRTAAHVQVEVKKYNRNEEEDLRHPLCVQEELPLAPGSAAATTTRRGVLSAAVVEEARRLERQRALIYTDPLSFPRHVQRVHFLTLHIHRCAQSQGTPYRLPSKPLHRVRHSVYAVFGYRTPDVLVCWSKWHVINDFVNLCRTAQSHPDSQIARWVLQ